MRSRAYRRHQRARTKARHLRDYYELSDPLGFPPPKDIAVRHPRDCGRRCYLCHYDKLMDQPPRGDGDWRALERAAWD
jgi:hypothetical protein